LGLHNSFHTKNQTMKLEARNWKIYKKRLAVFPMIENSRF